VVFALVYWLIFPTWPIGDSWTKGLGSVTVSTLEGEGEKVRWNTRYKLIHDLEQSGAATRQREFMDRVTETGFEEIVNDPEMLAFARSVGNGLFGDNCAACHGRGGQGVVGLYPNLADDDWLWGGTMETIEQILIHGRKGYMPPFRETFTEEQLDDVAEYVLTLSDLAGPTAASARGRELFQGQGGGCFHCHGMDGKGLQSQGAANLTDKIWTIANVPAQKTHEQRKEVVKSLIWNGVLNIRNMPGWQERLTPSEIKLLAVYVHQLGGGE
jgi:cytochrome c oxidase cbb3-type subunit 3